MKLINSEIEIIDLFKCFKDAINQLQAILMLVRNLG